MPIGSSRAANPEQIASAHENANPLPIPYLIDSTDFALAAARQESARFQSVPAAVTNVRRKS